MLDFKAKMHKIQNSAGARPQTPLGELTALQEPLAGFKGPTSKGMGMGREGRGGDGSVVKSKTILKRDPAVNIAIGVVVLDLSPTSMF